MLLDIFTALNINIRPELDRLPSTDRYVDVAGIQVPLYGELLAGEEELRSQINQRVLPYLEGIKNLYESLGNPPTPLSDLISQLQLGKVIVCDWEPVELDYDLLGYRELRDLADRAGVQNVFMSIDLLIDGQKSLELLDLIIANYAAWVNNGIPVADSLTMANHILQKRPVRRMINQRLIDVDGTTLLSDNNLTWGDVFLFHDIDHQQFPALLLIFFRTGISHFNPLHLMLKSQAEAATQLLMAEYTPPVEEVVVNANVQTQTTTKGDQPPLESAESTAT